MAAPIVSRLFPLPIDWAEPVTSKPTYFTVIQEGVDGSELRMSLSAREWYELRIGCKTMSAAETETLRTFYQTLDIDQAIIPVPVVGSTSLDRTHPAGSQVLWVAFLGALEGRATDLQITRPDGVACYARIKHSIRRGVGLHIEVWPDYRGATTGLGLPWEAPFGTTVGPVCRGRFIRPPEIRRVNDEVAEATLHFLMKRPDLGSLAPPIIQQRTLPTKPEDPNGFRFPPLNNVIDTRLSLPEPVFQVPPAGAVIELDVRGGDTSYGSPAAYLYTANPATARMIQTLGGDSQQYAIRLHLEGYISGVTLTGHEQINDFIALGGTVDSGHGHEEQAKVVIGSPAATYWLNAFAPGQPRRIDTEFEVVAAGNTTLTATLYAGDTQPIGEPGAGVRVIYGTRQWLRLTTLSVRRYATGDGDEDDWADDEFPVEP